MSTNAPGVPGVTLGSLKARMIAASVWVVLGSLASHVLRLLSTLVMTRLLFPEAFGLMIIATTVTIIIAMLSDIGIQQSIVRGARGDDPIYLDTAWSIQIVRGVVMWMVACGIALCLHLCVVWGWVAATSTYADPLLPWIIVVSSFSSVIFGFQATDLASASRRLDLKPGVALDLGTQFAGLLVLLALAWAMRSVWALVVGGLASALLYAVLSHRVFGIHKNRWGIDPGAVRDLLAFGKWMAVSSAVWVFVSNGDRLILGALVDTATLGLFSVAVALSGALDLVQQTVFSRVVLPAISQVAREAPARVAEVFFRSRWRIDPFVMVAAGMLYVLGPLVVSTLYDERYRGAGEMLQILSLGLVTARFLMVNQVYLALNQPRYHAVLNLVRLACVVVAVPAAFHRFGLVGALYAIALRDLSVLPLILFFNARHGLNNFRLEFLWLLFWPAGWCAGWAVQFVYTRFVSAT